MAKRFEAIRIDKGEITQQGYLKCPASFTRTGVFKYMRKDGSIVGELRASEDVFEADSLASLSMAPLTDDHPTDFLTPKNTKELAIGYIGEKIDNDGRLISGTALVFDEKAIQKVNDGKHELSCGYTLDLIKEDGIYEGIPYQFRQKNIRYNHVALVTRGRAGSSVALRLDADDALLVESEQTNQNNKGDSKMKKIIINGKEYEVAEDVANHIVELTKNNDALVAKNKDAEENAKKVGDKDLAKLQTENAELKKQNDIKDAKIDELTEQVNSKEKSMDDAKVVQLVKERAKLEKVATAVLGEEAKLDSDESNIDLMKRIVAKKAPAIDLKTKSDDYVRARFDGIADNIVENEKATDSFQAKVVQGRKDGEVADSKKAYDKQRENSQKAYLEPLAAVKK